MNILVIFVEVTNYNIARINKVYETIDNCKFEYVYCNKNISGNIPSESIPENVTILNGNMVNKLYCLYHILQRKQYDFIIINGYSDLMRGMVIEFSKIHKIPYAIETDTQLSVPKSYCRRILKKMLLSYIFSDNAYGFAGGTLQIELFKYYGMNQKNIYVLPMTVDIDKFQTLSNNCNREKIKNKLGMESNQLVLYSGRFSAEKNISILIKAMKIVSQKHSRVKLLLVGKGNQKERLLDLINDNNLKNTVYMYDYKSLEKLVELYSISDVFVLPSSFEPWGLVVNESLACKTPVIVSNKVGSRCDLIKAGKNGDIFEYNNSDELAILIEKWLFKVNNNEMDFSINDYWNYSTYKNILINILKEIRNDKKN